MSELRNIIQFYRDCYQTDLKGIRVQNFISSQCEKRIIPDNNDLFLENYGDVPVDAKWAKEVSEILFLNSKEKILYAGSVFIKGTQNILGKRKKAFSPLYIHELELHQKDEVYFLSIKETFFNPDFVELANNSDPGLDLSFDILTEEAPPNPFGFENHIQLKSFFKIHFKSWKSSDLDNYQKVDFNFSKYYRDLGKKDASSLRILSSLMIGVFKRPQGSLGVLNDLNKLADELVSSKLLSYLFQYNSFEIQDLVKRQIYLPTTLSKKQESAFYGLDAYPITQIVGPPGTGKSYTISALAIDAISNNKSVLIVTKNVQSSRVIVKILEEQFGIKGSIIKAYNQVYKRSLTSKLSKAIKIDFKRIENPSNLSNRIRKTINQINQIEDEIINIGIKEYEWGEFYSENQEYFFSVFKDKWYQYRKRTTEPIWKLNKTVKNLRKEKVRLVKKYIKVKIHFDLNALVRRKKKEFIKLNLALKEKKLTQLDEKLRHVDFGLVLQAVPLWTTTTKEVSKCIPLVEGLFDIVIFDEASQCDIATAIPTLYRAKKTLVVGDPHQLRHLSFLSGRKQSELKSKNGVKKRVPDYRKESLIDWTNSILSNPDQTTYLDEHFRSKTDLIQFSNQKFYDNQLKLIRSNPISDKENCLEISYAEGTRDSKGVNSTEVNRLLDTVIELIEKYAQSSETIAPTIGISSPFSEQVKHLKKKLSEKIPFDQIKKHKILIGTPYHFQGEERDLMLISFCIDENSHRGSINYLNREDVFNVLVTRARNRQIVFTSVKSSKLPRNSLLKEYLEFNTNQRVEESQSMEYDLFFEEVSEYLHSIGYDIIKHLTVVSGVQIDLVILHQDKYYCIDLIGYPGVFEDQFNMEDLRILNRVDIPLFFLPFSSWYLDNEKSKKNLIHFIKTN